MILSASRYDVHDRCPRRYALERTHDPHIGRAKSVNCGKYRKLQHPDRNINRSLFHVVNLVSMLAYRYVESIGQFFSASIGRSVQWNDRP
jgi:hypothetical protein